MDPLFISRDPGQFADKLVRINLQELRINSGGDKERWLSRRALVWLGARRQTISLIVNIYLDSYKSSLYQ